MIAHQLAFDVTLKLQEYLDQVFSQMLIQNVIVNNKKKKGQKTAVMLK